MGAATHAVPAARPARRTHVRVRAEAEAAAPAAPAAAPKAAPKEAGIPHWQQALAELGACAPAADTPPVTSFSFHADSMPPN